MKARIQVGIRLRPFLESEVTNSYSNSKISVDNLDHRINVQSSHGNNAQKSFEFDHIFEQNSQQSDVYADCDVSQLVARVLDGFHSTIFAYGQTGSGKTYTMEGKHDGGQYQDTAQKGIAARALDDLFSQISALKTSSNKEFSVTCSFLQIYNERIYDLLGATPSLNGSSTTSAGPAPSNVINSSASQASLPAGLRLRWTAREQFQVENLSIFSVKSAKEAQGYFLSGVKNRVTASHKLNMTSSRSHTIFTISVHTFSAEGAHETSAKLQLVDLAGSERISQTGTEGKMAKESIDINKSLFTLRQVITALSEINQASATATNGFGNNYLTTQDNPASIDGASLRLQHIPYRESKLTSLLKQSIGGNCYCLMLACIVPSDAFIDENVSTLHYASRATYIRNQPVKNEDPNKQLLAETKNENSLLRAELEKANAHIAFLTAALEKSERNYALLKNTQNSTGIKNENIIKDSNKLSLQNEEKLQLQSDIQEMQGNVIETNNSNKTITNGATTNTITASVNHGQVQCVTGQSFYAAADYDNFSDRLIESITLVRQLLESNKELRQQTDESKQKMTGLQSELADLTRENQELREQLASTKGYSQQQFNLHGSRQLSNQNSVQRPPRPIDVPLRSLDATESAQFHSELNLGNGYGQDNFQVDGNNLSVDSKSLMNKQKNQDKIDSADVCQIQSKLDTTYSTGESNFNPILQQQKLSANSTKNTRTEHRQISKRDLNQEFGVMVSSHPRIKSQDATDRQGIIKISSNQSSASKQRQQHTFYSASKKRINSLNQPRHQQQQQSYANTENQLENQDLLGQTLLEASLNSSKNRTATNFMNQTLPESQQLHGSQSQWSSPSIKSNDLNSTIIPAIKPANSSMDSAPTNFGRYTFYQQNFHNLEKLHNQQMTMIQQQGILVNEIGLPKAETSKFSADNTIQRFNTISNSNNLIVDKYKLTQDSQLIELNTNHLKRTSIIIPQTMTATSTKSNRSNSLTKNQYINPSSNCNNGYYQGTSKSLANDENVIRQRNDKNKLKQPSRKTTSSFGKNYNS